MEFFVLGVSSMSSYAEPGIETDVDAKVHEGKILPDVSHEFSLAGEG